MNITINDLPVTVPFRVYDMNKGYIYSMLDRTFSGDIPPDIAILPVVGLRAVGGVLYIDTCTD